MITKLKTNFQFEHNYFITWLNLILIKEIIMASKKKLDQFYDILANINLSLEGTEFEDDAEDINLAIQDMASVRDEIKELEAEYEDLIDDITKKLFKLKTDMKNKLVNVN